jgi:hypothetical protein
MYWFKKEQFHKYKEMNEGVLAIFDTEKEIVEAAKKTFEKKYEGYDCILPYPIHGIDEIMGTPRSGLPWVTFFMGVFGLFMGFYFQYLTHSHDWALNIGGKSLNAWYAYIPITFEMIIFCAGIYTFVAFCYLAGIPKLGRKIHHPDLTSHKFGLWIPSDAKGYKQDEVIHFVKSLGAKQVEVVAEK